MLGNKDFISVIVTERTRPILLVSDVIWRGRKAFSVEVFSPG
jgi:hypothetical protein